MSSTSPAPSPAPLPRRRSSAAGRTAGTSLVARLAGVLAVVSVVSLAVILVGELLGARVWAGFVWIALLAFPVAFVLLGCLVIAGIRHRRSA